MAQRLVSKTDFARAAGISGAAISKGLRGPLRAALVGGRIDIDHPAAVAYLAARGKKPPAAPATDGAPTKTAKRAPRAPASPTAPVDEPPKRSAAPTAHRRGRQPQAAPRLNPNQGLEQLAEREEFADLTIRELAGRFGTFRGFTDLLDALKTIAQTHGIEIANEEKRGGLIDRDLVRTHVFGAWDGLQKKLLTDSPRVLAARISNLARAGGSVEEAEALVREHVSSLLHPVKLAAARALRAPKAANE